MSAPPLLDFECRAAVGGYDVVEFDQTGMKSVWNRDSGRSEFVLAPNATDDERYLANRWGDHLLIPVARHAPPSTIVDMLRPRSERNRRFNLFQSNSSAFLEFAGTPLTPDGIKAFADVHGPLLSRVDEKFPFHDFWGHNLRAWGDTIKEMRKAVDLWDKSRTTGDFSKLIRVLERRSEIRLPTPGKISEAGIGANVLLKEDPRNASARLCIRPTHLRDALWIQLALAIDGSESLRTCVECKKWFTISAGQGRSDKEYCSDACRMRAYRKRKGKQ
jgi:hypothetical protein